MEDRRAAFPTHDEPHHNILDGPNMPTHSDPINVVHRRYWALLAVAVVGIGLFSFYSPVRMVAALHCSAEKPNFSYALVHDAAAPVPPEAALPLSAEASDALQKARANHILQQDAVFEPGAIVVYPDEDTNYALYAAPDGAYVFALDKNKFRYRVQDGADLYQILAETVS